jgi:hypothetical protein
VIKKPQYRGGQGSSVGRNAVGNNKTILIFAASFMSGDMDVIILIYLMKL